MGGYPSKFAPARSRPSTLTLILTKEASTGSDTHVQAEENVHDEKAEAEDEDQCDEFAIVSPNGKGKRRGKLFYYSDPYLM